MTLTGRAGTRLIARREWTTQRWKNGAGVTHEIFRWSASEPSGDAYDVRLSVAEIEGAQPFSLFPGYARSLVVLDDTTLALGGQPMPKGHVFHFPGDVPMATTGSGRATDLNVISRADHRAHVEVSTRETHRHSPAIWPQTRRRALAVFALEHVVLRGEAGEHTLEPGETWLALAGDVTYDASAPVVWIRFG